MFEPFETINLGPISLSYMLLFLIVSIAAGYFSVQMYLKTYSKAEKESVSDALIVAIILSLIVYKSWPFILEPSLITSFQQLLYYSGGPYAILAASTVAVTYFGFQYYRKKWSSKTIDSIVFGSALTLFTYSIFIKEYGAVSSLSFGYTIGDLTYHMVNVYYAWFLMLIIVGAFLFVSSRKRLGRSLFIVIGFLFAYVIVSPFQL
ncbi:hypothetical protein [Evansella halocellulosilytica]|uniref:hypothetical protein n=1 Tax=Evansella halocellulosilytica TaxID=2011013 RepID=UPI000BB8B6BF|nr:hypothetical protein [Evansella halocellulosilytica]